MEKQSLRERIPRSGGSWRRGRQENAGANHGGEIIISAREADLMPRGGKLPASLER
jgi:hypothetical protein